MADESDDEGAPTGEPAELEIHVNLRHPDLMCGDGTANPRAVEALLTFLPQALVEALGATLRPAQGAVMDTSGRPMAYWLFNYKAGPMPLSVPVLGQNGVPGFPEEDDS